jgi:hypothetical protein
LDGEIDPQDASHVLLSVLQNSASPAQTKKRAEGKVEVTDEGTLRIRELLGECRDSNLPVIIKDGETVLNPMMNDRLESLLPCAGDDEDAFKGLWDIVIEIHGREAVKLDEANRSSTWTCCCTVARLLIHYDFLSDGV